MGFAGRYPDSHPPLWRQSMRDWLPDELEEWEERAAIRTYLGDMKREHAEQAAWRDVVSRVVVHRRAGEVDFAPWQLRSPSKS